MKIENLELAVRLKVKRERMMRMSSILRNTSSVVKVSSSMLANANSEEVDDPILSAMLKKYIDECLIEINKQIETL